MKEAQCNCWPTDKMFDQVIRGKGFFGRFSQVLIYPLPQECGEEEIRQRVTAASANSAELDRMHLSLFTPFVTTVGRRGEQVQELMVYR